MEKFAVIVIGAGHAGCEAALASARMGSRTLLLTMNRERIGFMSCNPAIGGQAKGQLAREVDALGGEMGVNTDKSALQYKRLNSSKGPAVRSSRAQCDKVIYSRNMRATVESQPNLTVAEAEVRALRISGGRIEGVITAQDEEISAGAVIITAGTFMGAVMHCGQERRAGGRAGDSSASRISVALKQLGFELVRLKTGTPARLRKETIDFSRLEEEWGDKKPLPFSFFSRPDPFPFLAQMPCYLTYTNPHTHEIIAAAKDLSPMFTGAITGRGPRYCPSIEDKVFRFADKDRHQIFLEPESQFSNEIYANGVSTSLPEEVQQRFLRTIAGLEAVEMTRSGYAVEYDAVNPVLLTHGLESKDWPGLYFAGQVNGTSGYEEAAAQGFIAGANAALSVAGRAPFILGRHEAYIGVLIDDLVTKGCDEPYRMFTSRAEYRLLLREDTADRRLAAKGYALGTLDPNKYRVFERKINKIKDLESSLGGSFLYPRDGEQRPEALETIGVSQIKDRISLLQLLRRPELSLGRFAEAGLWAREEFWAGSALPAWLQEEAEDAVEIETKYAGYIQREEEQVARLAKQESKGIPPRFDYKKISGLSNEVRERLERVRPESLGQALRIPGVTPAAAALVLVYLEKGRASP